MMVIFKSEISATATGVSSGMKSGSVEAYTFTFPLMRGAISHLTIQFPTLFSSHTTDICGAVPPQEGSNTASASKFNRFLYIIRKLSNVVYSKYIVFRRRLYSVQEAFIIFK